MYKVKILWFACVAGFTQAACNNAQREHGESEQVNEQEAYGESEAEEEDEKNVKFDAFEEAITSKVNGLKPVQDAARRLDSVSNGSRRLNYRVVKDRTRVHVYDVVVYEANGADTLRRFQFHVDSLTGNVLNPDGKL